MLMVHTSRLWLRDVDALDITRGGPGGAGKPGLAFAPSRAILVPALAARTQAKILRDAGDVEEARQLMARAWIVYSEAFRDEMRRRYIEHRQAWEALLSRSRVVLQCFCDVDARLPAAELLARGQCHRFLVTSYLCACGAVYGGELALPKRRAA